MRNKRETDISQYKKDIQQNELSEKADGGVKNFQGFWQVPDYRLFGMPGCSAYYGHFTCCLHFHHCVRAYGNRPQGKVYEPDKPNIYSE